jgi:hypothetical protein
MSAGMACGDLGFETLVGWFTPDWGDILIQTLPEFLMQWVSPSIVYPAIELAQVSRFEFGETPSVVPLRLAAS